MLAFSAESVYLSKPNQKQMPNQATTRLPLSSGIKQVLALRVGPAPAGEPQEDLLAVEEPLEIKLGFGPAGQRQQRSLAVTMRTPGQDEELALGFLFTEGLIGKAAEVTEMRHLDQAQVPEARDNILLVELAPSIAVDYERLSRHFYTSSSCGVCGKSSIELVEGVSCYYPSRGLPLVAREVILHLPRQLLGQQALFECTGGIHAAAAFDAQGQLIALREDVGRHNALDKLLGAALAAGQIPLRDHIVMLSGRLSFELVQKAAMAGVPIMAAVGAPSSLAVELAQEHGMTLIGFLRGERFNIYCGEERIVL
jgi:FdhD protein